MQSFDDLFSSLAREYASYRPGYPSRLTGYLASLAPDRSLVWDCATGSGQATLQLAGEFERVLGTDASLDQVCHAARHPKVVYCVSLAEAPPLPARSISLVTVAQAVHWFDMDRFYAGVRRVLKPGGILAVWGYIQAQIATHIDPLISHYYSAVLGPYWSPRMRYLDEHYQTLPFPFEEIDAPDFSIDASWDLTQLVGFMASWSATRPFQAEKGFHPLELVYAQLVEAWGDPERKRPFHSPLFFRVGRYAG